MNIPAIYHRAESNYCFALDGKTVVLRIRFSKEDVPDRVSVLYNNKYDIARHQYRQQLHHLCDDSWYSYYSTVLHLKDSRLAYVFEICHDNKVQYFCEYGITEQYDFNVAYLNSFQYAYINANDITQNVPWLNNAVFYQVFPDRFYKASQKDEGYINSRWGQLPDPKSFYGGDLDGITSKLDYIKSLNVNALYLTPVFCGISNHKYDIYDYYNVDPMFGGNQALKRLVEGCHKRGIRVVLDAVFNHISDRSAQFQDVLKRGKQSPYFNWFVIEGDKINEQRDNYCQFASCPYMPKLDTSVREVQQYFIDVATYWIKKYDIDGWRLDVSDEVSHDFWRMMRKAVRRVKSDAVLIGENWHNSESYLNGDQFDSIMNYAFTKQMIDYFVREKIDEVQLALQLNGLLMRYTDTTNNMMFNLLDCHDTDRFYSLVKCDKDKYLCALAMSVFMPGSCNIYYGDEIMTEGGYDPDNRRTFDWNRLNDCEVKQFVQQLTSLLALKQQPALQRGDVKISGEKGVFVIKRSCDVQTIRLTVSREKGVYIEEGHGNGVAEEKSNKYFLIQGRLK